MKIKELNSMKKQLDSLFKEVGAYGIQGSWIYDNGLKFQCKLNKIQEYAKANNKELQVVDDEIGFYIGKHWFYGI